MYIFTKCYKILYFNNINTLKNRYNYYECDMTLSPN